jgi:hypothetical protein
MNENNESGWGIAIYWVHQDRISGYENISPLTPVKMDRISVTWTVELESLRRGVRCSTINSDQIRSSMVGISVQNSGIMGRRYGRHLRMHAEPSLVTHPGQVGKINHVGNLKLSWDL